MPLPAALAAKLAKRGLVTPNTPHEKSDENSKTDQNLKSVLKSDNTRLEEEEEVIAENYDDQVENQEPNKMAHKILTNFSDDSNDSFLDSSARKFKGYIYCPNKNNIFHDCTKFCEESWEKREPNPKYMRRRKKMLAKYPLPSHWKEVYDAGIGHYYYWEVDSDSVSWLPPSHPKAVITEPAAICRQQRDLVSDSEDNDSDEKSDKSESTDEESDDEAERKREVKRRKLEELEKSRAKGRNKLKVNNIDPMDPAAYSDCPRGGWSDGLNKGNEAKTGVDTTAAGSLYQMRPYPSPGSVLRANKSSNPETPLKSDKPAVNKPEKPKKQ
ncbi:polyglutamine-binding protein 1-like [Macrosteles quadrilineatus]|uniref:polyglutamine-binding protein 1-like n=1 Tax=Macrosteles quadrilineatus TaxID=74068 RepID=UPI0023E09B53|nr:polyglutamine-binding protein 1-like [Macrosteles quadrilineatus]